MSSQASAVPPTTLTVYQHLLRLHQSEDLDLKQDSLTALPESLRQQIFDCILPQMESSSELNDGQVHIFDSLPKLQRAVEKVAANAFYSLNQIEKNGIASKIWDYAGRPRSEDPNWGENHATDNPLVLLKTMHDALGDLTPELQQILDKWVEQAEPEEKRIEARSDIIDFLRNRAKTELNLNVFHLKNLPLIFNKEPFISRLETLKMVMNCLSSLPPEIGQLQNLSYLDLSTNKLLSLPPEIGQLKKLESLFLPDNLITTLPAEIGNLQNLKKLYPTRNQLSSLPEQIGQLQNLTELYLSGNQLTSLPEQIGQLQNLRELSVVYNQFRSLPEQIGLLQNLRTLKLGWNQTLQGLPNQLLYLHPDCEIDITGIGLSEHVRANLQQTCNAPGYQGPRITFSMEHGENHQGEELKPLPILIAELFSVLGEESRAFPQLEQLDDAQKGSIQSWLSRLSDTAGYKRSGEFQKAFVKQIIGYLQEAEDDPQFREAFLNIIADAAETCGDRISLSILHVGIASRLRQIKDIHELRRFLIGTVWPVQMLEEIARKKTETLRFYDEIEVYLGYPIMLREKLGLEIAVQDMLYFRCSALNQIDLDLAAEFVMQQQNDEHALCSYLASREDWTNALKVQYPERCAEIDEENFQELEAAGEDQEKLDQLKANQKQRWEALTAWALVAMDPQCSHNNNP